MNVKTIVILVVLAVIIAGALKSLWKHLKGEQGCGCGGSCSSKKDDHDHHHGDDGCCCSKK